jgi:hypothetical protein
MEHPLGWLEHRQAWDPAWNPDAQYAKWVLNNKVAIRINDTLFLHGGISGFYCLNSLGSLTESVRSHLKNFQPGNAGILEDDFGPLWYRGLSGVEPLATPETVDAILAHHGIKHIAVGHTPTSGVIWPRYDAKVIMIDTGISRAYGGHLGYLEITSSGLFAGYQEAKLPIPATDDEAIAYLEQVIQLKPDNPYLRQRLNKLQQPPLAEPIESAATEPAQSGETVEPPTPAIPVCGISQ